MALYDVEPTGGAEGKGIAGFTLEAGSVPGRPAMIGWGLEAAGCKCSQQARSGDDAWGLGLSGDSDPSTLLPVGYEDDGRAP